ncbi:hypothetical protein T439DRAFT_380116 [Meredithblackwellia eburnea MCA 4105]
MVHLGMGYETASPRCHTRRRAQVDKLVPHFKTVHNFPQLAGNDYSGRKVPLPTNEALASAEALICFHLPANLKNFPTQTPNLKFLHLVGAGAFQVTSTDWYKSIPDDNGLVVANSTGIHVPSISEHVLMSVMALNHKLLEIDRRNKEEKRWLNPNELGGNFIQELRGQTFGILGYGHLGRETARLAKAFGCNIIACTREGQPKKIGGFILPNTGDVDGKLPSEWFKTTDRDSLKEFLGKCDVLVNCLPDSKETKRFIGKEELGWIGRATIVVNIGRGETMDQEAFVESLRNYVEDPSGESNVHRIRGAVIDVTDPEPLPNEHPLFTLPNVVLTPHVSWASKVNFERSMELFLINKSRLESGEGALNALRGKGEIVH